MARWGFGLLLLLTLLLVAMWVALNGWIVPRIDQFRPQLEQRASAALGTEVRIGALTATAVGWLPVLQLHDVVLLDAQGREALRLQRVVATPSWRSLLQRGLEQIYIEAPALQLRRSIEGQFFVAGLALSQQTGGDTALLDWLLAQREIVLRRGSLHWTDELRGAPLLALQEVDLVLRNSGRRHGLRLDATPPPAWGQRFSLRADLRQPLAWSNSNAWQRWGGQLYAEFPWVDLAQLRRHARPGDLGISVAQGTGALRIWADMQAGAVYGAVADVALSGVQATMGPQLEPLVLHSVQGRVAASRQANGFAVSTKALQFETDDDLVWPGGNMALTYAEPQGNTPAYGELRADRLELALLRRVADRLPLGDALHNALRAYAPAGRVEQIDLQWQGPLASPSQYRGRGRVTGLELAAQPAQEGRAATPGVRGADVEFDLNQAGGRATLAMRNGALDLPGIFDEPVLDVDQLRAQARWQIDGQQLRLQLDNLHFANADAAGRLRLAWRSSEPDASGGGRLPGVLDLSGSLSRAQAQRVHRYLPTVLDAQARNYVREAVQAGVVTGAQFRVKGDLRELPFRDPRQGEFRIAAQLRDVVYDYAPARLLPAGSQPWPALDGLAGELVFERAGMRVRQARGRLAGLAKSRIQRAEARIADLQHPVVEVDAGVQGPLAEMLSMVASSPVSGWTAHALDSASGSGNAALQLGLKLPLQQLAQTGVRGRLTLTDNEVRINPDIPLLSRTRGAIDFTDKGFSLQGVQARMLGGEVRLDGGMPAAGVSANGASTLAIRAQGEVSADGLRQASELGAVARLAERMAGSTPYSAALTVRQGVPELQVSSTLQGMALELPAPLRKPAAAALPLRLERNVLLAGADNSNLRDRLQLRLGALAALAYERDLSGPQPLVMRGVMAVQSEPAVTGSLTLPNLPATGVLAQARLGAVDLDAWRALAASVRPGAGAAAQAKGDAMSAYWPTALSLRAQELTLFGRTLHDVVLGGRREDGLLRASVTARELQGLIEYRPAAAGTSQDPGGIFARLSRLNIPRSAGVEVEQLLDVQPSAVPSLDLVVEALELGGYKLGRVALEAINRVSTDGARDWWIKRLLIQVPEAELTATGSWRHSSGKGDTKGGTTALDFRLDMGDVGELLTRLGMAQVVRRGKGLLQGQLGWDGSALALDYASLSGNLKVDVGAGQFLKVEPGPAKLLGVLNLQALPRRLALDFRDVFSQGFSFDSLRGDVRLAGGVASTDNLQMRGVNAAVLMDGSADLKRESQNLRVLVVPELHTGTASLVAAMINPAIGLGTFLAQLALKGPLTEAATREFRIDGDWTEPRISRVPKRGLLQQPVVEGQL